MSGLLIVNADDWGHDREATDAILGTFEAGRITSATGMVYMADSDRAAEIANGSGLPIGLHINLTEPFSDPATPARIRDLQRRVAGLLGGTPGEGEPLDKPSTANLRRWIYDPRIQSAVDESIAAQLARFRELYAASPTHFDGHTHVDLCPNVFRSRAIPKGTKLRSSLNRFPVERSLPALARTCRQAWRSRLFPSTRYLFHIRDLRLGGDPLDPRLALAEHVPVEVMGHPGFAAEQKRLMSAEWGEDLRRLRLGSFADLDTGPAGVGDSFRLLPPGVAR